MRKYNEKYILNFIIQLTHPNVKFKPTLFFPASQVFWDKLIKVASKHLVLPSIYGAIIRKKIEKYFPEDILTYLNYIYQLNSERNHAISEQIEDISGLFSGNGINYLFLKGSALLIQQPKRVLKERMIGDIDILVSEKDIKRSYQLLIDNGYAVGRENEVVFTKSILEIENKNKHLKRLINDDFIAAVEIHRTVLSYNYSDLLPTNVLMKEKQKINQYFVPSNHHMWLHTILNYQLDDNGMRLNILNLKTVIDVAYIEPSDIRVTKTNYIKPIFEFYNLLSIYLNQYPSNSRIKKFFYLIQLNFYQIFILNRFFFRLFSSFKIVFSRFFLILKSKNYRKAVMYNPKLLINKFVNFWKKIN